MPHTSTRKYFQLLYVRMLHKAVVQVLGCDDGIILHSDYSLGEHLRCNEDQIAQIVARFLANSKRFRRLMDKMDDDGRNCWNVPINKHGAEVLLWARANGFAVRLNVSRETTLENLIRFFQRLEEVHVMMPLRKLAEESVHA